MVSHICLLVELGPICNSMAASLCLKSCEDHSLLKSYNGGLWKNNYRSGTPYGNGVKTRLQCISFDTTVMPTALDFHFRFRYRRLNFEKLNIWIARMVEFGSGPIKESIDNTVFIIPGIIIGALVCKWFQKSSN